jgi:hypothetical protein
MGGITTKKFRYKKSLTAAIEAPRSKREIAI